jgi:hypothetical protein
MVIVRREGPKKEPGWRDLVDYDKVVAELKDAAGKVEGPISLPMQYNYYQWKRTAIGSALQRQLDIKQWLQWYLKANPGSLGDLEEDPLLFAAAVKYADALRHDKPIVAQRLTQDMKRKNASVLFCQGLRERDVRKIFMRRGDLPASCCSLCQQQLSPTPRGKEQQRSPGVQESDCRGIARRLFHSPVPKGHPSSPVFHSPDSPDRLVDRPCPDALWEQFCDLRSAFYALKSDTVKSKQRIGAVKVAVRARRRLLVQGIPPEEVNQAMDKIKKTIPRATEVYHDCKNVSAAIKVVKTQYAKRWQHATGVLQDAFQEMRHLRAMVATLSGCPTPPVMEKGVSPGV